MYMYVFTVFKPYVSVPLYSAKGTDDVALNKKIKFICLFVMLVTGSVLKKLMSTNTRNTEVPFP